MKFLAAIVVTALMALTLAWGILQATHGSYWLLVFGVLGYLTLFGKLGCLPPKSH